MPRLGVGLEKNKQRIWGRPRFLSRISAESRRISLPRLGPLLDHVHPMRCSHVKDKVFPYLHKRFRAHLIKLRQVFVDLITGIDTHEGRAAEMPKLECCTI